MPTTLPASDSIWSDLFAFQLPPTEKVIRTVLVYLVIAFLIRVGGKRTLAQLNTFDLVVVLLLSNVVQNAIIGEDNSLVGGALGAVVLIAFNAVTDRLSFLGPRAQWLFEGSPTTLIREGRVDRDALRRVGLREHELTTALHKQQADGPEEVSLGQLQPGGTFDIELMPQHHNASTGDLDQAVARLQRHLDDRFAALEARLPLARD